LLTTSLVGATALDATDAPAVVADDERNELPILFVHGFMGSGQQFEAQSLRFASNGYPADRIDAFEHDSLAWPGTRDQVWAGIDAKIDDLLAASGAAQIVLVGHSQGTGVSQGYLNSDPARAARVAKYINLDGGAGGSIPASVDGLAIWGEGDASRSLPGAHNVQFADQSHTEVVNSPESFAEMYRFVTGAAPVFADVVRETGTVQISGRALLYPETAGPHDATMRVWRVEPTTGTPPAGAEPVATIELSGDGSFGPLDLEADVPYEFEITRPGAGVHHVYPQPFVRSSNLFRVLTSEPGGLADSFWEPAETTQNLTVLRNEEWWADQGDRNDVLAVDGTSVLTAENSPRSNRTIGIFLHDAGSDGISGSVTDPPPSGLPFLTGIDLVIPAADPAEGTTSVRATPRNGAGDETVCLPALSSTNHRMSVQFNSYHHLLNPDGSAAAGQANPECAAAPTEPTNGSGGVAKPARPVTARPAFTG
jgi:pimeloyl-ACP methyl ester carboxylesterase